MFICDRCHNKLFGNVGDHMSGSHGPCEECRYTQDCQDCNCTKRTDTDDLNEDGVSTQVDPDDAYYMIGKTEVRVVRGSVIDHPANMVVNAANVKMRGGGGVDGAFHKAAGLGMLMELEFKAPHGGFTGIPVLTNGYNLKQDFVAHVAGPMYYDGNQGESMSLMLCYANCLQVADGLKLASVAFPSISTGIYRYPLDNAAETAIQTVTTWLRMHPATTLRNVTFVMFDQEEFDVYHAKVQIMHDKTTI